MSHPMVSCSVVFTCSEFVIDRLPKAVASILEGDVWPTGITVVGRGPSKRLYRAWVTKCRGALEKTGIDHKIIEPDRPIRSGEALNDGVFESKALWIITPRVDERLEVQALLKRIHAEPERGELLLAKDCMAFRFGLWAAEALKECGESGSRRSGYGGFSRFTDRPHMDFLLLMEEGGKKVEEVPCPR